MGGFISDLRGELTNKSARILRESYLKVGGDGTTLKYSWGGRTPPSPLGSYASDNNKLNKKITITVKFRDVRGTHAHTHTH